MPFITKLNLLLHSPMITLGPRIGQDYASLLRSSYPTTAKLDHICEIPCKTQDEFLFSIHSWLLFLSEFLSKEDQLSIIDRLYLEKLFLFLTVLKFYIVDLRINNLSLTEYMGGGPIYFKDLDEKFYFYLTIHEGSFISDLMRYLDDEDTKEMLMEVFDPMPIFNFEGLFLIDYDWDQN